MKSSFLSLATRVGLLVPTHGACPILFVLRVVKQSKTGLAEDSWEPRIDIGHLVKVFPNVGVTRLSRPFDLGLTVPVQLPAILSFLPPS
jgi:hypothetical protein